MENQSCVRKIEVKEDGVFLTINPPMQQDCKLFNPAYLLEELQLRGINILDEKMINDVVRQNNCPIKIAESHSGNNDALFKINISHDEMEVKLIIYPSLENGKQVDIYMIKQELTKLGVNHGIDDVAILKAIQNSHLYEYSTIALGKNPIDGNPAKIEYFFNVLGFSVKLEELEDGRIDFYNTKTIENATKGQLLAQKMPPSKGIPGFTVKGRVIPGKEGKNISLLKGKNVVISEDGFKAYAEYSGHPVLIKNHINVLPVYEVKGDVNFSTGNIYFDGNVIIHGSIKNDFTVKATGEVEVKGNVEAGHIQANGNITVKYGIVGMKKSCIKTKSNLLVKFIENAQIDVDGNITVSDAIMHSNVNCGGKITVGGKKGLIVGGVTRAAEEIHVKNIGSNLATTTIVEVGVLPELRKEYNITNQKISRLKDNLEKTEKALRILKQIEEKLGKLPSEKSEMKTKLNLTFVQIKQDLNLLINQFKELEEQINNSEKGLIKVSDKIFCGVNICIGRANTFIKDELKNTTFYLEGFDIKMKKYNT